MVEDMGSNLHKVGFFSVIGNRISNTFYHFQYLYYPGGNETGAKPNLITCITEIFLSAYTRRSVIIQSLDSFKINQL
jgi:hypothetical protein